MASILDRAGSPSAATDDDLFDASSLPHAIRPLTAEQRAAQRAARAPQPVSTTTPPTSFGRPQSPPARSNVVAQAPAFGAPNAPVASKPAASPPASPRQMNGFGSTQRSSGAALGTRVARQIEGENKLDRSTPAPGGRPAQPSSQGSQGRGGSSKASAPKASPKANDNTTLFTGKITKVIYNADNFYVLMIDGATTIRGKAAVQLSEGITIRARCTEKRWKDQKQWTTDAIEEVTPLQLTDIDGIRSYLASGAIEGVGKVLAEQIVSRFGADTFNVILNHRDRLLSIPNMGQAKISKIVVSVKAREEVNELMSFLARHGIGPGIATRIVEHFESGVRAKIEQNPYRLTDVDLVGFRTADAVALSIGIPHDSPDRIAAALAHCLDEATSRGNTMIATFDVVAKARELLEVSNEVILESVRKTAQTMTKFVMRSADALAIVPGSIAYDESYLTPRKLFDAERSIAKDIERVQKAKARRQALKPGHERASAMTFPSFTKLDRVQQETALLALSNKLSVITGGPGCGKTTVTRSIVDIAEAAGLRVQLISPTGRAARRMAEATGREAHTIHHALQPGDGGFRRGRENPLECELLIVDEHGMTDTALMKFLMRAVSDGTSVIFVGDADQLPSVGPGNVLRDLIASDVVPVGRLKTIHRQAAGNPIIAASHSVIAGKMPQFQSPLCMFMPVDSQEKALHFITSAVRSIISRGEATADQIQVLTPTHRGEVGTENLNIVLRDMLNPDVGQRKLILGSDEKTRREFREGDRVMQLKNDKNADISNGDMGYIRSIDAANDAFMIDFGGRPVTLTRPQMMDLKLAYACTVHKSQGSEFPVVIMTMMWGHSTLLNRNLIYTGMTRAKQRLLIIGEPKAFAVGVAKADADRRVTGLGCALKLWVKSGVDILPVSLDTSPKSANRTPTVEGLNARVHMDDPFDFSRSPDAKTNALAQRQRNA